MPSPLKNCSKMAITSKATAATAKTQQKAKKAVSTTHGHARQMAILAPPQESLLNRLLASKLCILLLDKDLQRTQKDCHKIGTLFAIGSFHSA
ncbi:MAG: hypothetical protein JNM43_15310 [Planctomycetaceae bacterium]|nr:hypothetical protein [Planctomycetaceae bacterium]